MLKLETTELSLLNVTQINTNPSVYLDHWALRMISSSREMRDRFCNALIKRDGMLEISWMNLLEFSGVSDLSQVEDVENFLDTLSPKHIGFINVEVQVVIELENKFLRKDHDLKDPHVDYELLKEFAKFRKRKSLNPCSFKGFFFELSNHRKKSNEQRKSFLKNLSEKLPGFRERAQQPEYQKKLNRIAESNKAVQHSTRYIFDELGKYILRNGIKIESNDWCDIHHLIVPMAYCDLVLVDQRWNEISKQVSNRLRNAGHDTAMADIFSKRQIADFWKKLDN